MNERGPSIVNFAPATASFFAHVLWINRGPVYNRERLGECMIDRYPVGWATIRTADDGPGDVVTAMVQWQEGDGAELIAATDPIAWAVNEALIGVYPGGVEPPRHAVDSARKAILDRAAHEQAGESGETFAAPGLALPQNSGAIIDAWGSDTPLDKRAASLGWSPPFSPVQFAILTGPETSSFDEVL